MTRYIWWLQELKTLMFRKSNQPGVISSFQVFRRRGSQDAAARLSDEGEVRFIYLLWPSPRTTLYSGLTQTEIEIGPSCPPPSVRPRSGSVPSSSIRMAQLQGDKIHTKLEEVWNCLTSRISNMFEKGHNSSTTSKFLKFWVQKMFLDIKSFTFGNVCSCPRWKIAKVKFLFPAASGL